MANSVSLSLFLGITEALLLGLRLAFIPTLLDVLRNPLVIFRLSQTFMTHLWAGFSDGVDQNSRPMKEGPISTHSHGVVLDLGAVTRYIALEPNVRMHDKIRQAANASGFQEEDRSLVILGCGAEDLTTISDATTGGVDTLISVLTVCSIPDPKRLLTRLVENILKPGGNYIFYEHVRSPRDDVARWQKFYTPVWGVFFDGCRLNQPTDKWVEDMKTVDEKGKEVSMWSEGRCSIDPTANQVSLVWHVVGRFVKKATI
ncbi:hypothetical protein V5O48_000775 [Marasmius crinis-equi]|uniref:S-adenosyl-L-methionine-dependent methyltransferase n=1 Tax=Marasmius crinis-equi TaxID=585013 RepID=A0ABR3G132_9AGAR